jgi:hypothetical protein
VAFVVLGVALLYYAAPDVAHLRWYWVTPGSLVATAAWILLSLGLRLYVSHFSNYTATYGSIAGVILLLLWLYLTGLVLLVGAKVNAEIEHAAAEHGAATAKARGEKAPGVDGRPLEHRDSAPPFTAREPTGIDRTPRVEHAGMFPRVAAALVAWLAWRMVSRGTASPGGHRRRP